MLLSGCQVQDHCLILGDSCRGTLLHPRGFLLKIIASLSALPAQENFFSSEAPEQDHCFSLSAYCSGSLHRARYVLLRILAFPWGLLFSITASPSGFSAQDNCFTLGVLFRIITSSSGIIAEDHCFTLVASCPGPLLHPRDFLLDIIASTLELPDRYRCFTFGAP